MAQEKNTINWLNNSEKLSFRQQIKLVIRLSIPAILAEITSIVMQYIDAAMVGSMGAKASAAIGLISSSSWLLGGLCISAFHVQSGIVYKYIITVLVRNEAITFLVVKDRKSVV